ncbi:MAG: CehA/McbA family metallohydrolase domain-containing protein, partial [Candidatus Latescibacterota bacterium]
MRKCIWNCSAAKSTLAVILCGLLVPAAGGVTERTDGEYIQVTGLIHLDSTISGGENTPGMLAAAARNAGAEFAVLTDHDSQKVTYGIWPFRKFLRISYSRPSVRSYGVSNYLREVEDVDSGIENFTLLPGIEAVPYYSWGRGVDGSLVLRHLHRHILVMGLNRSSQLENLPSIESGFLARFTRSSLLGLLWLVPFLVALFMLTVPPGQRREARQRPFLFRASAWAVLFISVFALAEAYPFQEDIVDQYEPDREEAPYQMLIDYVNRQGGLTFWAHPEAAYRMDTGDSSNPLSRFLFKILLGGGLSLVTDSYPALLNATRDYTGFAIFNEGAAVVGKPEGLWDDLLMQFCTGRRTRPVWAIAELDMESGTSPDIAGETRTVLIVRNKTPGEYLAALRNGRMYCFTAFMDSKLSIREYSAISGDI